MKNFPHQFNNLGKLQAALALAAALIERDEDIASDQIYGEALARAGVYSFRGKLPIEEALRRERRKPRASRGTETAARDIRRFLTLCGFIQIDAGKRGYVISNRGKQLLTASQSVLQRSFWREALLNLALSDAAGNISHPYRILLRLVNDFPGIETSKLMLALEAKDDSSTEYERVSELANTSMDQIVSALGASSFQARNAVKILPAIADQLRDIVREGYHSFPDEPRLVTEDTLQLESMALQNEGRGLRVQTGRPVTPEIIAGDPQFSGTVSTTIELADAIEVSRKRMREHQEAVRSLAGILDRESYQLFEFPFDCLGFKPEQGSLLVEVKTLDGSARDERKQAERALGQVKGYRYFNYPSVAFHRNTRDVVAFTDQPQRNTTDFLIHNRVDVLWRDKADWMAQTTKGRTFRFQPTLLLQE